MDCQRPKPEVGRPEPEVARLMTSSVDNRGHLVQTDPEHTLFHYLVQNRYIFATSVRQEHALYGYATAVL